MEFVAAITEMACFTQRSMSDCRANVMRFSIWTRQRARWRWLDMPEKCWFSKRRRSCKLDSEQIKWSETRARVSACETRTRIRNPNRIHPGSMFIYHRFSLWYKQTTDEKRTRIRLRVQSMSGVACDEGEIHTLHVTFCTHSRNSYAPNDALSAGIFFISPCARILVTFVLILHSNCCTVAVNVVGTCFQAAIVFKRLRWEYHAKVYCFRFLFILLPFDEIEEKNVCIKCSFFLKLIIVYLTLQLIYWSPQKKTHPQSYCRINKMKWNIP